MKTVYRVLTALLSLAVLPVLFFVPLLRIKINLPLSLDLGIKEYSSIFSIIKSVSSQTEEQAKLMKTLMEALTDKNSSLGGIFTNRPWFYTFLVFLCLTAVVALALCVISFLAKKPGVIIAVAGGGLLSAVLMNAAFSAFARPLITGEIGLKSLLGGGSSDSGGLGSLLTGLIGNAVTVEHLQLSFAYLLTLLLFGLVVFACIAAIVEKSNEK